MENQSFRQLMRGALFAATQGNRLKSLSDAELAEVKGGDLGLFFTKEPSFQQTPEFTKFPKPDFLQAKPPKNSIDSLFGHGFDLGHIDFGDVPLFWR